MNGLPDLLLVGTIVVAAAWYAARSLGPRGWRARGGAKAGTCGGCDGCASAAPGATSVTSGSTTATGASETRIPVTAIGHRRAAHTFPQNRL